ncbi:MAG: YkgJ family cysteine cluster protein [Nitrospirota bacterium]|jgi:Fe-S-cluster containining protein
MNKKLSTIKKERKRKKTTLKDCSDCPALCCHDLSITILKPRTRKEIDDLMWHLNYDTVGVYIRNRRWHLIVKGVCQYLGKDNLCTIYDDRFDTCRKHLPPYCERYDDWYDVMFRTPFELRDYLREEKDRWRAKGKAGASGKKARSRRKA